MLNSSNISIYLKSISLKNPQKKDGPYGHFSWPKLAFEHEFTGPPRSIRIGICIIAQADSDVWKKDSIYLLFSWPLHYIASGFTNTSTLKVSKINMVISQTP